MSDMRKEVAEMRRRYGEYARRFAEGGISNEEQMVLDALNGQIQGVQKLIDAGVYDTAGAGGTKQSLRLTTGGQAPPATVVSGSTGSIAIKIVDSVSQKAIKNAIVTVAGVDKVKNESSYTFMEVPPGNYDCTCTAKGYGIFTKSVRVEAGKEAMLPIALVPSAAVSGEIEKGVRKIDRSERDLARAIAQYWDAYRTGLSGFGFAMLDEEVEDSDTKSLLEVAIQLLTPIASFAFPAGIVIPAIKTVAGEVAAEAATALKEFSSAVTEVAKRDLTSPSGGRKFREYMVALAETSHPTEVAMTDTASKGRDLVEEVYRALASAENSTTGVAEQFLQAATGNANALTEKLRSLTNAKKLQAQFATNFANTKGQTPTSSKLDTSRDTGTLYFEITCVTEMTAARHDFEIGNDTDKKWKLVMLGNKRDAQGAARSLLTSVGKPWLIEMPRKVRIDVYDSVNKRDRRMAGGWMVFKVGNTGQKPDSYESLEGSYWGGETGKTNQEWVDLAWANAKVRAMATENADLEGATA